MGSTGAPRASPQDSGPLAAEGRRGRGSVSNAAGRYERERRVAFDDGWDTIDEAPPPLRTTLTRDASKSVIARNDSPDLGFNRSINPYRGCEHGCVYCFARPTHAFLGLSPGLDFESKLTFKPDAPALLERALRRPNYRCEPLAIGTNTDPYQPVERRLGLTREILKVMDRFGHPISIVTKSNLIVRDTDILRDLAARDLVKVCVSVTSLDRQLARRMEPRAPTPGRRLEAIAVLKDAGIPVAVLMAPLIPALNDVEIEDVIAAVAEAGAAEAGYVLLRLPLEIKDLWQQWLDAHYPDRAGRIMRLLSEMRGGRAYDSRWGRRMVGEGPYARLLQRRFDLACRRRGLNEVTVALETRHFAAPQGTEDQPSLF